MSDLHRYSDQELRAEMERRRNFSRICQDAQKHLRQIARNHPSSGIAPPSNVHVTAIFTAIFDAAGWPDHDAMEKVSSRLKALAESKNA